MSNDPVVPAPDQGDEFPIGFRWDVTLDSGLVDTIRGLGIDSLAISDASYTTKALGGATGPDVIGSPPDRTVPIGTGAVTFHEGPFKGTFTRTSAVGDPITFAPGTVKVAAKPAGFPNPFNLSCTPAAATSPLSLVDQQGTPPPSSPTTDATVLGETVDSTSGSSDPLPRTGAPDSTLVLLGLSIVLIDLGYLLVTAQRPVGNHTLGRRIRS
jgi:hypothetical protein